MPSSRLARTAGRGLLTMVNGKNRRVFLFGAIAWLSLLRRAGAAELTIYGNFAGDAAVPVPARVLEMQPTRINVLLAITLVFTVICFRACRIVRIQVHLPFVSLEIEPALHPDPAADVNCGADVGDIDFGEIDSEEDLIFYEVDEPPSPPPLQTMPAPPVLQGTWGAGQHAQRDRLVEATRGEPCPACGERRGRKTAGSNNHFIQVKCMCDQLLRRERVLTHAELRAL